MKKLFTLLFAITFCASSALAYNGTVADAFYSKYLEGFYSSMSLQLVNSGIAPAKVDKYLTAMKGRINQKSLEKETINCVLKNDLLTKFEETNEVGSTCLDEWSSDFMTKNTDLLNLLK